MRGCRTSYPNGGKSKLRGRNPPGFSRRWTRTVAWQQGEDYDFSVAPAPALQLRRRVRAAADRRRSRNRAAFHRIFRRFAVVEAALTLAVRGLGRGRTPGDVRPGADRAEEERKPGQPGKSRRL